VSTIEVTVNLPFFLRLEGPFTVRYEEICREAQLPELVGQDIKVTFSRRPVGSIDRSDGPVKVKERTTVAIKVQTPTQLSDDSPSTFAIRNCLEILNHVILSYYSTTGEISNAGFITPLGTSDMQLFAEIRVDGKDIRDRWPSQSINTCPLQRDQITKFTAFLTGKEKWLLVRLFLTNAILSLEQGQCSLAVLQAATAVELRTTQYVTSKLKTAGWNSGKIRGYEDKTLGQKLRRYAQPDLRSLETHFGGNTNFSSLHHQLKCWFTRLRNNVTHRGHLASHQEAKRAVKMAREFLKIVN